ncbi:hypothetical protein CFP56_034761 [Quercus suber]|uniref:Uncharacterized protein n=1 Tax=Quercus suber TaxID=58331 RepID=A0AAW0JBF3_QUESU
MDVEESAMESSILSSILNSIESNERGEGLSPEDIAWVDSCLIKDPESSETNMNSLKDALLEIFISQPELINSSAAVSNDSPEETDVEILPSSEEADAVQFRGRADDDLVLINKETKTKGDDLPINLKNNTLPSLTYGGNSFLLTNTEGLEESGSSGSKLDLGSSTYELEPSNVDDMVLANEEEKTKGDVPIKLGNNTLQVWDLDIPAEDGELVKQLNKALTDNSFESIPSTLNDSGAWKDLEEQSFDSLIAGISDLSLH